MAAALPRTEADLLRKLVVLAVVALAVGVAGGSVLFERDDGGEDGLASAWNTCTNPILGFSISYPPGWYTDHPTLRFACIYFDPRPLELARDGNWGPTALQVTAGPEEVALGRFERSTNEGMREYGYVVEEAGRRFSIFTTSNQGIDYSSWKRVVDQAVASFVIRERGDGSTEGDDVVSAQVGLPEPVARKRARLWAAARANDHDALARLADPSGFEYTFGGPVPGGQAAYWRRLERTTAEKPLETLVEILELPHVYQEESRLYVWPDAFARNASSLTNDEKEQLADAIGVAGLKLYERLGNYLGYRAGIDAEGEWVFYVAGD